MDLIVNAVVPVIRSGKYHGACRAADRAWRIASLEEHPGLDQTVQVRGLADGSVGDAGPHLLVRHNMQDVRLRRASFRVCQGGNPYGLGEEMAAIHGLLAAVRAEAGVKTS